MLTAQQAKADKGVPMLRHKKSQKYNGLLGKDPSQLLEQAVMVTSVDKIDKHYDDKVMKLTTTRDKKADSLEAQQAKFIGAKDHNSDDLHRFLSDALNKHTTRSLTRKANLLVNKFEGGKAGFGLVLEELLVNRNANAPAISSRGV